ncbi:MAG: YggS family pyridoxal phosphate-dependent enzyme [Pseudomonadota bacterium]
MIQKSDQDLPLSDDQLSGDKLSAEKLLEDVKSRMDRAHQQHCKIVALANHHSGDQKPYVKGDESRLLGKDQAFKPQLIAVSKTHDEQKIWPLINAGQRHFGENRIQETTRKWPALTARYLRSNNTQEELVLHLIGPLQTNKVELALSSFDVIQTLDRPKLAYKLRQTLDKMKKQNTPIRLKTCLIQVNIGAEDQKSGIAIDELPAFLKLTQDELELPISGLMCIPPIDKPASLYFALLKKLADCHGIDQISMGMSHDFETAIELGATMVRVGTALFGTRAKH